jgi:protocatechuate 3,4-dioxygenase beta subunit
MNLNEPKLSRRAALAGGAAALAAAVAPTVHAAAPVRRPLTVATTEGPYYFDARQLRSDITEGLPGVPLDVQMEVVDAQGRPLKGLRVDLWHCDAQGRYSGYDGQGEDGRLSLKDKTFLRGHQLSDAQGLVAFRTVYPGWYAGRTTHIHFKVIHRGQAVLTSQFFLPDALSEFLYTQVPQYRRAALRDTLNSNDGIALRAGDSVIGAVREQGDRYLARLDLVVDPGAHPQVDRPPAPGGPPPGGGFGAGPGFGGPGGPRPPRPPQALQGEARVAALLPGKR